MINVDKGPLQDDPAHNAEWNHGRYLVEALAHCDACHTPRNITFGMGSSRAFCGGDLGAWTAYNITLDKGAVIGNWNDAERVQYSPSVNLMTRMASGATPLLSLPNAAALGGRLSFDNQRCGGGCDRHQHAKTRS